MPGFGFRVMFSGLMPGFGFRVMVSDLMSRFGFRVWFGAWFLGYVLGFDVWVWFQCLFSG